MKNYQSTRSDAITATASEAILAGIAPDGGLYLPRDFAGMRLAADQVLRQAPNEIAARVLCAMLDDFPGPQIQKIVNEAYADRFDTVDPVPLKAVGGQYVLELWHGPTSAFKDMALLLLPRFITAAKERAGAREETLILTATSGDTGKAALEGFRDVPGTRIVVFYPEGGVSEVQKAQMVTQEGNNVHVIAVRGNFDDAQSGVKAIFTEALSSEWTRRACVQLSSANSINLGRLAPQVFYYYKAYADLVSAGKIALGDAVNFVVPTGNFGDILAGEFARRMGLPITRLICASNKNNVLTDFIRTGRYDRRRTFYRTASPSMDILISSNLERYLCLASGMDVELVRTLMHSLQADGAFVAPESLMKCMRSTFYAAWADDELARQAIGEVYRECGYVMDTHTAVGWAAMQTFLREADNGCPTILLSTASPYKFAPAVLRAIGGIEAEGFDAMERLEASTGLPVPNGLKSLKQKPALHDAVVNPEDMPSVVRRIALGKRI